MNDTLFKMKKILFVLLPLISITSTNGIAREMYCQWHKVGNRTCVDRCEILREGEPGDATKLKSDERRKKLPLTSYKGIWSSKSCGERLIEDGIDFKGKFDAESPTMLGEYCEQRDCAETEGSGGATAVNFTEDKIIDSTPKTKAKTKTASKQR